MALLTKPKFCLKLCLRGTLSILMLCCRVLYSVGGLVIREGFLRKCPRGMWFPRLRCCVGCWKVVEFVRERVFFNDMPEKNVVSWNSMIGGLIKNGDLEARLIFDAMLVRNIISLNTMISGYAENCRMKEARDLLEEMEDRNVVTWNSMISGYCRAGEVNEGYCLFCRMPERNIASWTAMIGGFTWNGIYEEALLLFLEMNKYEIRPNTETFVSLAYACAGMGFSCLGKQLHTQVIVSGLAHDDYDGRLSRSLIQMYSVFGIMDFAYYIFNKNLNNSSVQSYNALITGYVRIGKLEKAQYEFDISPIRDKISWTSTIDGYLSIGQVY